MLQRWLSCAMKRWRENTIHKTNTQKHFPICKFGNKQMIQEVALAQMHCATIWELKGRASLVSQCTGQMAFYMKLSDHQLISFSRQWLLRNQLLSFWSYQNQSPMYLPCLLSLIQALKYSVPLIPIILGWYERRGGLQMVETHFLSLYCPN